MLRLSKAPSREDSPGAALRTSGYFGSAFRNLISSSWKCLRSWTIWNQRHVPTARRFSRPGDGWALRWPTPPQTPKDLDLSDAVSRLRRFLPRQEKAGDLYHDVVLSSCFWRWVSIKLGLFTFHNLWTERWKKSVNDSQQTHPNPARSVNHGYCQMKKLFSTLLFQRLQKPRHNFSRQFQMEKNDHQLIHLWAGWCSTKTWFSGSRPWSHTSGGTKVTHPKSRPFGWQPTGFQRHPREQLRASRRGKGPLTEQWWLRARFFLSEVSWIQF